MNTLIVTHGSHLAGAALIWLCCASGLSAQTRSAVLEVFLRGDAEKSQAAREFVEKTYSHRPGLIVVFRDVAGKESELQRYYQLVDHFRIDKPGLPAFYLSGKFETGWDAATTPARLDELLTVEVFVRHGCPRCAAAKPVIFDRLSRRYPAYRFVEKDVATSADAQRRLQEVAQQTRTQATSVPAIHFWGRLMVGFYDANTSFNQWDQVLQGLTVENSAKTSRRVRRTRFPLASIGWFGSIALAGEMDETPADAPPPRPAASLALPPEVEPEVATSDSPDADVPPPRPQRSLPPEVEPVSELASAVPMPVPTAGGNRDEVQLPLLGAVNWRSLGLPAFTITVGLIDGFNPCAMWVLLFLLSLLVNLKDRRKILAVAGTFVFISGAAYFAFMAAWLNIFQFIGLLRPAQIALGLLGMTVGAIHIKDFFAFKKGLSLSIPESAKPGLYARMRKIVMAESLAGAILGASVLAVLVNVVELLCTAGLPAMYTGVLTMQELPVWENYAYLLLYNLAYMFDDALMVAVVVITLGKQRLQEEGGRWLKLASGVVIASIGTVMLLNPEMLV